MSQQLSLAELVRVKFQAADLTPEQLFELSNIVLQNESTTRREQHEVELQTQRAASRLQYVRMVFDSVTTLYSTFLLPMYTSMFNREPPEKKPRGVPCGREQFT